MITDGESGDAVVRIGNDGGADGKLTHLQAKRRGLAAKPRTDLGFGIGVKPDFHTRGRGGALTRVVIGRRADPAKAEHHVARSQCAFQRRRNALRTVADIFTPREFEPARTKHGDELRKVLVLALATHDFVSDDYSAKIHIHAFKIKNVRKVRVADFSDLRRDAFDRTDAKLRQTVEAIVDENQSGVDRGQKTEYRYVANQ